VSDVTFTDTSTENGTILVCQGVIFDTVDGLSGRFRIPPGGDDLPMFPSTGRLNPYTDRSQLSDAISCTLAGTKWLLRKPPPTSSNLLRIPWIIKSIALDRPDWNPQCEGLFYTWFDAFRERNKHFRLSGTRFKNYFPYHSVEAHDVAGLSDSLNRFNTWSERRLMTTSQGYVGYASKHARPGDTICVILGCCDPMILRKNGDYLEIVGLCYVAGIMNGEIMGMVQTGEREIVEMKIR